MMIVRFEKLNCVTGFSIYIDSKTLINVLVVTVISYFTTLILIIYCYNPIITNNAVVGSLSYLSLCGYHVSHADIR